MRDNERYCINCVEDLSSGPAFELKKELLQLIHGFIIICDREGPDLGPDFSSAFVQVW